MELRDEVRDRFKRSHRLAKRYYDEGSTAKAKVEYLKCAQFMVHLAKLSPPERRNELLQKAAKFREIAKGLAKGDIEIYTDGIKPPVERDREPEPVGGKKIDEAAKKERIRELIMVEKPEIRFKDVAGLDAVKEEIKMAIVEPFKHPEEFKYYGVKSGGGILFYGPPGCGKTMMAAAAAAECDATFINLKISDIKDKYVGESEKNIKEVFALAREYKKSILFFDEIDAIAGDRSSSSEGHEKSLVNEMLAQMDGVDNKGKNRALVLAATNIPWAIDTALRRSGRFDTVVFIPNPDFAARKKIFEINLEDKPVSGSVNIDDLAKRTRGFASSEIAAICDRAAKIPLKERLKGKPRRKIEPEDFDRVLKGWKTILSSWYPRAYRELKGSEEEGMFSELLEAAKEYTK